MFGDDVGHRVRLCLLFQVPVEPRALGPFEDRVDPRLALLTRAERLAWTVAELREIAASMPTAAELRASMPTAAELREIAASMPTVAELREIAASMPTAAELRASMPTAAELREIAASFHKTG